MVVYVCFASEEMLTYTFPSQTHSHIHFPLCHFVVAQFLFVFMKITCFKQVFILSFPSHIYKDDVCYSTHTLLKASI